jgi:bacteriocin-like protein
MRNFSKDIYKELTEDELQKIAGGQGKVIYFNDLSWSQKKCILSVAGVALVGTTTAGPIGALIGAGTQFLGSCL